MPGPSDLTDLDQCRYQPERADREAALLAGQTVVGLFGAVAQHQTVFGEFVGDGQYGGAHSRIIRGQEPQQGNQQQGGVQGVVTVTLSEHPTFVDTVGQDVGLDLVGDHPPLLRVACRALKVGQFCTAIQRHPAHHLR